MNIKNTLKKLAAVLLCLAVILTSAVIVVPDSYAATSGSTSSYTTAQRTDKLVRFAKKQLGKPYKYGACGPSRFDCIGYVYYVYSHAGVKLKSSMTKKKSYNLKKNFSKYIVSHSLKKAKPGDIIAYYSGSKTKHACIAIGNGKCITCRTKGGVTTVKLKGRSGCKVAVIRIIK